MVQLSLAALGLGLVSAERASTQPRCVLVTGSTDGIGRHTASLLSQASPGLRLLLHGRDDLRLRQTKEQILALAPSTLIDLVRGDLSDPAEVRGMAAKVLSLTDELDVFVQNAGVFQTDPVWTSEGLETTFAVNVAAPFLLAAMLFPLMQATPEARMLLVSSISQSDGGGLDLDDLQLQRPGRWTPYRAYGWSKRMVAMVAAELSRRCSPSELVVSSCDPGTVNTKMLLAGWDRCGVEVSQANDEFELVRDFDPSRHGRYFVARRESRCHPDVLDADRRRRLWTSLEHITGTSFLRDRA